MKNFFYKALALIFPAILPLQFSACTNSTEAPFPFSQDPNTIVFTCCHVLEEGNPILYVTHDSNEDWQFLCGKSHTTEDARLISLQELYNLDKSVGALADLKPGQKAERSAANSKWIIP